MQLPAHIKGLHFLVCDDYESMRIMVQDSLKGFGVTKISVATSGNEGAALVTQSMTTSDPVGFVITDLVMEDGTGIELTKKLRAQPSTAKVPVLMVTSKAEVSHVIESVKAGVNGYIIKPWSDEDFHKKIMDIYEKRKI